jgi:hypothetical protein
MSDVIKNVLGVGEALLYQPANTQPLPQAKLVNYEKVLSKDLPYHADGSTSQNINPIVVTCEPCNFGMRQADYNTKTKRYDYPVARQYFQKLQSYVNSLSKAQLSNMSREDATFQSATEEALTSGKYGVPAGVIPKIQFLNVGEKLYPSDLRAVYENPYSIIGGLSGVFLPGTFDVTLNKSIFNLLAVMDDSPDNSLNVLNLKQTLLSSSFHEARHAQQEFWQAVYVYNHADDMPTLPNIRQYYDEKVLMLIKKHKPALYSAFQGKTITDTAMAICIKRMVLGNYLRYLRFEEAYYKSKGASFEFQADIAPARAAAHAMLNENVLDPAKKIDVDLITRAGENETGKGYTDQPWEEDAFFTGNLIKSLWSGSPFHSYNACERP